MGDNTSRAGGGGGDFGAKKVGRPQLPLGGRRRRTAKAPQVPMPIAIGRSVCIVGVVARLELNGKLGTVESHDRSRGRCGVLVNGELVSLRLACLVPEDSPRWERYRHGGPPATPAIVETVKAFIRAAHRISAPCLEHVRLFEPAVRGMTSPILPIILASMGIDAYVKSEYGHCRGFAVSAIVLDATRQVGVDQLFSQIAAGARSRSAVVEQLVARLAKCTSAAGLFDVLGQFATCQCLKIARARGVGLTQANIDPTPSAVDTIWGGGRAAYSRPLLFRARSFRECARRRRAHRPIGPRPARPGFHRGSCAHAHSHCDKQPGTSSHCNKQPRAKLTGGAPSARTR